MSRLLIRLAVLCPVAGLLGAAAEPEPLPRAEIAKLTKPATVLVEVKPGYGSGFCIHSSGLFLTNEHVVSKLGPNATATLILDPGLATQKTLKTKVVRKDSELDLALLQAEGEHNLPCLRLGSDEELAELAELVAFGFPFGAALAKPGEYPTITVNAVNVSSLRYVNKDLHRIQLDSNLNPGNSGGPVVDRFGKVVGVVVGGIRGAGINLAIPVRHVHKFLDRPVLVFKPPSLDKKNRHEPAEFQVTATSLPGDAVPLDLELILASPGSSERRLPMKGADGKYTVKAMPFPAPKSDAPLRVEIKYPDGSITGQVKDLSFRIGTDTVKLSEMVTLTLTGKPQVLLHEGRKLEGALTGLDTVPVQVGGQVFEPRLTEQAELRVLPVPEPSQLVCTIVARKGMKEVGRLRETITVAGVARPAPELVSATKFTKPKPAAAPTTYLKVVSTGGESIVKGQNLSYKGDDLIVNAAPGLVRVNVDGWRIEFAPPRGGLLQVSEYLNVKRYPFNDSSPGLSFSGHGRGSNRVGGQFVIWEMEVNEGKVVRLAIDFVHRAEEIGAPLTGSLRYNSTLE